MQVLEPDERAARALELHLAGVSYSRIATALGYANRGGAYKAAQRARGIPTRRAATTNPSGPQAAPGDPVDDPGRDDMKTTILTMIARLDAMLTGLWPKARRGDVEAVTMVLRIGKRRQELLALLQIYAPPPSEAPTGLSAFERRMRKRERGRS